LQMMSDIEKILGRVEREVLRISDLALVCRIRELLVTPYPVERNWDYGAPNQKFTCWTVLEHPSSNTGIALCFEGFGPSYPWGLVALTGPYMSIGMDCQWYRSLEDAMRGSVIWDQPNPPDYEVS
jgi:hypothetical protein